MIVIVSIGVDQIISVFIVLIIVFIKIRVIFARLHLPIIVESTCFLLVKYFSNQIYSIISILHFIQLNEPIVFVYSNSNTKVASF